MYYFVYGGEKTNVLFFPDKIKRTKSKYRLI